MAMRWLQKKGQKPPRYCDYHKEPVIDLMETCGIRVLVLGPPDNDTQIHKDMPTKAGQEVYEDPDKAEKKKRSVALRALFGMSVGGSNSTKNDTAHESSRAEEDSPFDRKYRIKTEDAAGVPLFRDRYVGTGYGLPEEWRRIDGEWMQGASDLAMQLDSDTNNTSLVLAIQLADGRVLLFPGDAQVGNWESWHEDDQGKKKVWKVDRQRVERGTNLEQHRVVQGRSPRQPQRHATGKRVGNDDPPRPDRTRSCRCVRFARKETLGENAVRPTHGTPRCTHQQSHRPRG